MTTQVTASRLGASPAAGSRTRAAGLLRRHRALVAVLAAGALLRIVALVAVYPGIWFSDSNNYVSVAATGTLSIYRVSGYALFVTPFLHLGSAGALIITQHLMGLALGVLVYALLLRRGTPRWLALAGAVPLLLDAYLIDVEHTIMAETAFHAAVLGAVALLLWRDRLAIPWAAGAGLLLGYASVVRSVGLPFLAIFLLYLLVRRVGWRPLAAFFVGWAVVALAYAAIFDAQHDKFGFTAAGGRFLAAKVVPLMDCPRLEPKLPADERRFCPDRRLDLTTNAYLWNAKSPIYGISPEQDGRLRDFAKRVIRDRPYSYARLVVSGFVHYFEPGHRIGALDYSDTPWHFPRDPSRPEPYPGYRGPIRPGSLERNVSTTPNQYVSRLTGPPSTNARASRTMRAYQRVMYTGGQVLLLCLLVVAVALVLRRGAWRQRLDAALLTVAPLAALFMASLLSVFSYRYALTAVVLLPPAAALAGAALLGPAPDGPLRLPRRRQRVNRRSTTRAAAFPSSSPQNSEANAR